MNPKILLFDIETFPALGWFWERYETNILAVKHNWYIISFAYKWLGNKEIYVHALPDFSAYKRDKRNDKELCLLLHKILKEADIVIAHYGDQFDIKKANARFIAHGFEPVPPTKSIDTRKVAAKRFNFGSNKLNDLAKYFNIGEKSQTGGFQLWLDCGEYDKPAAWKTMKEYNKQDVILLEKVYMKMRPWIERHPNINFWKQDSGLCPNCGSIRLQKRGFMVLVSKKHQRFQCQDCGAWTTENLLIKKT